MAQKTPATRTPEFSGLDQPLAAGLPAFEQFFKTFGFKRVHGRVWGLLVLSGQPLSSREIGDQLSLSQGATSTCLSELTEWGAIHSGFDAARRCHLHDFKQSVRTLLGYVRERYGEKDPRVFTLRSILSSLEIADAVLQLVFSSVERALGDSGSLLSRAVRTALKVGMRGPARKLVLPSGEQLGDVELPETFEETDEVA